MQAQIHSLIKEQSANQFHFFLLNTVDNSTQLGTISRGNARWILLLLSLLLISLSNCASSVIKQKTNNFYDYYFKDFPNLRMYCVHSW